MLKSNDKAPILSLNCKGRLLALQRPAIMGIINTTPDSFYEESRAAGVDAVLQQAARMIAEGADILDIGGQSTRPGSVRIGASEELARVLPAITAIHQQFPEIILSVDTYHAEVARAAVAAGAGIVNDVSGGLLDEAMLPAVAALRVPFICMHMKGSPGTMQQEAVYDDVVREVLDYFIGRVDACRRAGITDIILDPGFGFAKTAQHNFILLRHLRSLQLPGTALLAGLSRKSTIYKTLGTTAAGALNGTTVLHTIALLNGAQILRVHDVKEAREVVTLVEAYENNKA